MRPTPPTVPGPARFLGAVIGFIFAGLGLTVLGFLWTASGFGEPPLFFKVFGSFIALAFVALGGTAFFSALKAQPASSTSTATESPFRTGGSYTCPACGARLGESVDVSPGGDVKCDYCRKWFNIHR